MPRNKLLKYEGLFFKRNVKFAKDFNKWKSAMFLDERTEYHEEVICL